MDKRMSRMNVSIKVDKGRYRVPIPKRRMQLSANVSFSVCSHKGRWIVALTEGWDKEFSTCNTLSRSNAIKLISFLSDYVNLVKPTETTVLNASIRAKTNSIVRDAEQLTGLAMKNQEVKA